MTREPTSQRISYAVVGLGYFAQSEVPPAFKRARRSELVALVSGDPVRAARAGVHVLCEKPMALTEEECERMISACEAADVRLMIAYRLDFERTNLEAIELVTSGKLGEPRLVNGEEPSS